MRMIPSSRPKGEFCFRFPLVPTPIPSPEFWPVGGLSLSEPQLQEREARPPAMPDLLG